MSDLSQSRIVLLIRVVVIECGKGWIQFVEVNVPFPPFALLIRERIVKDIKVAIGVILRERFVQLCPEYRGARTYGLLPFAMPSAGIEFLCQLAVLLLLLLLLEHLRPVELTVRFFANANRKALPKATLSFDSTCFGLFFLCSLASLPNSSVRESLVRFDAFLLLLSNCFSTLLAFLRVFDELV